MPLEPGVSHTGCCFVSFLQPVINTSRQSVERKAVDYSTAERHREENEARTALSIRRVDLWRAVSAPPGRKKSF